MATKELSAFQRVFSRKDLVRGEALRAAVAFAASSLGLCLGLVVLYWITDLLIHVGRLEITAASHAELLDLVGSDLLSGTGIPAVHEGGTVTYVNRGILPTLWRDRGAFWIPVAVKVYQRFSPLQEDRQALLTLVGVVALVGWGRSMLESRARVWLLRKGLAISTRLRQSIHRQTHRLAPSDLQGRASEQALRLFTTEVDQLRAGVIGWAETLARDPLRLVLLLMLALLVNPSLAIICLVPMAFCWWITQREKLRLEEFQRHADAHTTGELRLLAEGLDRSRLVRGYAMESFEQEQFQKALQRFERGTQETFVAKAWSRRMVRSLVAACVAFVLLFVGRSILLPPRELGLADGLLMMSAFVAAGLPLGNLARLASLTAGAEQSAQRIQSYLNQIPEVGQAVGAKFLQPLSRLLVLEGVTYATPDKRTLLEGLTLRIPAGRQVAVVATDPMEGLALAYLLPRFIEPQKGRILIDGEDIGWVTLESLRAEAIFVGGKDPYLTATIRENISGGNPNYSLQDVTEAAKAAHAHQFINKLPQGYETVIGEHGEQLDPGQAFRLGLARAALRKPALLIIEEPDAPLDEDTKTLLDDAYKRITPNRTVLYLARRLSTVKRADEIVLLHKGRLAAIGPHARLVQTSPLYRHWEYIHFNEFRHEFEAE
ncbi:MAG: ABC transporter ATP-binding protein [Planctomycetales bacterium]